MNIPLKVWRHENIEAKGHFENHSRKNLNENMSFLEMLDALNEQILQ